MSFVWTREAINEMTELAERGVSSSDVAAKFGTTRSSVLGKAFRIGIKFKSVDTANKQKDNHFIWNDKALNRLQECAFQSADSAKISKILSREFDRTITPQGVRTKASALGIAIGGGRTNQIRGWRVKGLKDPKRVENMKLALGIADVKSPEIPAVGVTFEQLKLRSCRYPLGGPRDSTFRYCGNEQREASPYCEGHHQLCYRRSVNV